MQPNRDYHLHMNIPLDWSQSLNLHPTHTHAAEKMSEITEANAR